MESEQGWADDRRLAGGGNQFGAIRLLLAVSVLWSHCFPIVGGPSVHDPLGRVTNDSFTVGTLAVNAFLLISGFCVMNSLERSRNVRDFVARRVRRVYPAFVVLSLITAFVVVPFFARQSPFDYSLAQLGLIGFETANLVGYGWPYGGLFYAFVTNPIPGQINTSLWTIRYEFVCYLVLAAMFLVGLLRTPKWCAALAAAGSALAGLVGLGLDIPWHKALTAVLGHWPPWPRFLGYFFVGVTFYLYRKRIPYSGRWASIAFAGLLVGLAVPVVGHALGPVLSGYLVFWMAFQSHVNLSRLSAHGDFSYGFYLWAFPTQQAVLAIAGANVSPARLFFLATPLTLFFAVGSWFLVERRFLRRERVVETSRARVPELRRS